MDRVIYKYPVTTLVTRVPFGPLDKVRAVATQNGVPTLWIEHSIDPGVESGADAEKCIIRCIPTGSGPDDGDTYLGTAHDVQGVGLVFHIYMAPSDSPAPQERAG